MMAGLALKFGLIVNAFIEARTEYLYIGNWSFCCYQKKILTNDYKAQKIMECSIEQSDGLLT